MEDIDRTLEYALAAPFPIRDIEWRIQSSGKLNDKIWASCLVYVTNRAIMHRLDECVGIGGWWNEAPMPGPGGGVIQGLTLVIGGREITKWDGAENTQEASVKGGLSGAMKRSAVLFGIGRYLYNAPDGFAKISKGGQFYGKTPKKYGEEKFKWDPPANMLDFVMAEYDPKHETTKQPAKDTPLRTPGELEKIVAGFIENMNGCNGDELEGIKQRIKAAGITGMSRNRLLDVYNTRLAQIDIDRDN